MAFHFSVYVYFSKSEIISDLYLSYMEKRAFLGSEATHQISHTLVRQQTTDFITGGIQLWRNTTHEMAFTLEFQEAFNQVA